MEGDGRTGVRVDAGAQPMGTQHAEAPQAEHYPAAATAAPQRRQG